MPNVNAVLNDQVRRLGMREITSTTDVARIVTVHYRHAIAALIRPGTP